MKKLTKINNMSSFMKGSSSILALSFVLATNVFAMEGGETEELGKPHTTNKTLISKRNLKQRANQKDTQVAYAAPKEDRDGFSVVTLSSTQLPRDETDKDFSKDFMYQWNLKTVDPKKESSSARTYAEEVPFISLAQLMKIFPDIPEDQQYSVRFTEQDTQTILDLYYQGKLQLTWAYDGLTFNQYCAHRDDPFHTLAVTLQGKNVTYYKQQRYIDDRFSQVGDIFFDSRYQVEYWYDQEKKNWVLDHPYRGEVEYLTRQKALKTLKKLGRISFESELLSFFVDPSTRWARAEEQKMVDEASRPSLWKVGAIGWLALTGDIFRDLANGPLVKSKTNEKEAEKESLKNMALVSQSQQSFQDNQSYVANIFSTLSPYTFISPMLISLLSSKDGKISSFHLLSTTVSLFPVVRGDLDECREGSCIKSKKIEISDLGSGDISEKATSATTLAPFVPLSEGYFEYNNEKHKFEHIVAIKKYTVRQDLASAEVSLTIANECEEVSYKPLGWMHDDQKALSYATFDVYCHRTIDKKLEEKKIPSHKVPEDKKRAKEGIPHQCNPENFDAKGGTHLIDQLPELIAGQMVKECKRPDNTIYETKGPEQVYHLHKHHVKFIHEDRLSYQVVKLSTDRQGIKHVIDAQYTIKSRAFLHQQQILFPEGWNDDKVNHVSTNFAKIFIDSNNALDASHVNPADTIVKNRAPITQEHEKLWLISSYFPGKNYKIPHSGEEY